MSSKVNQSVAIMLQSTAEDATIEGVKLSSSHCLQIIAKSINSVTAYVIKILMSQSLYNCCYCTLYVTITILHCTLSYINIYHCTYTKHNHIVLFITTAYYRCTTLLTAQNHCSSYVTV